MNTQSEKKQQPLAKGLYLVVRGPMPGHRVVPYPPIIVCSRQHTAKWEGRGTQNGATIYWNHYPHEGHGNWFLGMYKGYEFDTFGTGTDFTFFDGKTWKELCDRDTVDNMLNGAVWWSYDTMPEFVNNMGVVYAEDDFSKHQIWLDSGTVNLPHSRHVKLQDKKHEYKKPEWLLTEEDKELIGKGFEPRRF